MALALYLAFLGVACAYALTDWRRGWFLVLACGVIQDPVRKLTAGAPVVISFAVIGLYGVLLFSARREIAAHVREFSARFGAIYTAIVAFLFILLLAGLNGMFTFGFSKWPVPLLSLFTYCAPLVAAVFGYAWLQREEWIYRYFLVYATLTSIALVGTVLEYMRVDWQILGMVGFEGDYIRHLPGIQIRLLSGIYRGPDVMALHAATLTSIAIAMAMRSGLNRNAMVWGAVASWGFLNCIIAGRRKAIYAVLIFCIVFVWRYRARLRAGQVMALAVVLLAMYGVFHQIGATQQTSMYAEGATASRRELGQRLEGGAMETFRQFGLMGAGLGTATQGAHHLLGATNIGWQEGGLGKLAVEVGLPGMLALALIGWLAFRTLMRLTRIGDVPGSSQFLRATLFAMVVSSIASFMGSAQAYTDAVLGLHTGFIVGALFASAALDERLVDRVQASVGASTAQPLPA